jgi:hypothetical protein
MIEEMPKVSLSANHILQPDSPFRALLSDSCKGLLGLTGTLFSRSLADLVPDEEIVDIEKLLDLALLTKQCCGAAILTMGRHGTPVHLVHGIEQTMYPSMKVPSNPLGFVIAG